MMGFDRICKYLTSVVIFPLFLFTLILIVVFGRYLGQVANCTFNLSSAVGDELNRLAGMNDHISGKQKKAFERKC